MNLTEHLLVCLIEECAEVQKAATKALRFGFDDHPPDADRTSSNAEDIAAELDDLQAVAEMLVENGSTRGPYETNVQQKKLRVLRFLDYSRRRGTLDGDALVREAAPAPALPPARRPEDQA